ncbi:hypothetical protein JCM8547_008259 [Rhodosporidiobolus lusitaniae]
MPPPRLSALLLVLPFIALFYLSRTKEDRPPSRITSVSSKQGGQAAFVNQNVLVNPAASHQAQPAIVTDTPLSQRIVAVGDIHGDLPRMAAVLRRAEIIDLKGQWIGGETILVQTGDIVDRGKDTIAIYRFFQSLRVQADKAGGAVISLLGNHEIMNALGDWRYVTPEDIASFGGERNRHEAMLTGWIGQEWRANYSITARVPYLVSSFPPGVPITHFPSTPAGRGDQRFLSEPSSSSKKGDEEDPFAYSAASFVHGGITPEYLSSLHTDRPVERINSIGSSIMFSLLHSPPAPLSLPRGSTPEQLEFWSERGPMWNRDWALEEEDEICERVEEAKRILKVRRLVMGHTPQFEGITARCGGSVLLIDTGISRAYDGPLSALEILHTLTPSSSLPLSDALAFGLVELNDPRPEETLRRKAEEAGRIKWAEREVVNALYTEGEKTVELARTERVVELPVR